MPAHLGSDMGVINPGIWESRLAVKVHNLCRGLQTIITAVLTVMSGPENSQNNWILVDDHLRCSMMLYDTLDLDTCSYGVKWEIKHNLIIPENKSLTY